MTIKLNLTIEEKTAKQIKAYAQKRRTSVSKIAETHFSNLLSKTKEPKTKKKSFVEKYAGVLKVGSLENIGKIKDNYLKEKHGV